MGAADSRILNESSHKQVIVKASYFCYILVHFRTLIWNGRFAIDFMGPAQGQRNT